MKQLIINIPRAEDARKAMSSVAYKKAEKQAVEIEAEILNAISNGKTSICGNGSLEHAVASKITDMGYVVAMGSQYNESYWSITWG